jgi:putative transposase
MSSSDERLTEWRELLADQRSSGMSVKQWCESEGISENRYYYWRKRLSEPVVSLAPASPLAPRWLPVALNDATPCSPGLTLRVGRVSVDVSSGFNAGLLSSVLNVLEARC